MIILERLQEVLSHDPYSREFTWKDMHRRCKSTRHHYDMAGGEKRLLITFFWRKKSVVTSLLASRRGNDSHRI